MEQGLTLPDEVDRLIHSYLQLVDAALPGFVERLYVVGSLALGAWQPPHSDIDTVIVASEPVSTEHLRTLRALHQRLPARPHFDGVYLERTAFDAQVADQRVAPSVVNGEFTTGERCGQLTPVLWLTLARHGIAVRGPSPAELDIGAEPSALRRYNLENLRDYWRPLADKIRGQIAELPDTEPVEAEALVWAILGPARLHYTLTYGEIVSKTGAASHIAEYLPAWADLAERAARSRTQVAAHTTVADLRAAATAIEHIVDDAWIRYASPSSPAEVAGPNRTSIPAWATEAVDVVGHDPTWAGRAACFADEINGLFAGWLVSDVAHVGSTAVPGLAAKPIIDLQAISEDPEAALTAVEEKAANAGWMFVPRKLDQRSWRWFFVRVNAAGSSRLAHLHLMPPGQDRWRDQLLFRDRLRSSARLRAEYTQVKLQAAVEHPDDREAYGRAKTDFVLRVLAADDSPP